MPEENKNLNLDPNIRPDESPNNDWMFDNQDSQIFEEINLDAQNVQNTKIEGWVPLTDDIPVQLEPQQIFQQPEEQPSQSNVDQTSTMFPETQPVDNSSPELDLLWDLSTEPQLPEDKSDGVLEWISPQVEEEFATTEQQEEQEQIVFDMSTPIKKEVTKTSYWKKKSIVNFFIFIFVLAILWIFAYSAYFYGNLEDEENRNIIQTKVIEYQWKIASYLEPYLDISKVDNYESLATNYDINWILNNNDISYLDKKILLDILVKNYATELNNNYNELQNNKQALTKYAFLPTDIDLSDLSNYDIDTIENSLLSLESIKFGSAISVFRYLDTFLSSLSSSIRISKDQVQENIWDILSRWEKDINLYIQKCYLNPYELDYDCNKIWDFDRYYNSIEKETNIDTNFFKKLMYYVDIKLEQNQLPSFLILFQDFDSNNDSITFDVAINTLPKDELELSKQWIVDPHVFILTQLINTLKQSRFIVWDYIKVDSLDVASKVIKIWITEFVVNSSEKSFTVPVKKDVEIEIYDFESN